MASPLGALLDGRHGLSASPLGALLDGRHGLSPVVTHAVVSALDLLHLESCARVCQALFHAARSATEEWKGIISLDGPGWKCREPALDIVALADGSLCVASRKGRLMCFSPQGELLRVVAEHPAVSFPTGVCSHGPASLFVIELLPPRLRRLCLADGAEECATSEHLEPPAVSSPSVPKAVLLKRCLAAGDVIYVSVSSTTLRSGHVLPGGRVNVYDSTTCRPVGVLGVGELEDPCGMAADGERLLVCDERRHEVAVLDLRSGSYRRAIGSKGEAPGQFTHPSDVLASSDHLFVLEHSRLQVLSRDGGPRHVLPLPDVGMCSLCAIGPRLYAVPKDRRSVTTLRLSRDEGWRRATVSRPAAAPPPPPSSDTNLLPFMPC